MSYPFSHAPRSVGQRAAFTLVELLVSMVVGVLLITFLFQLFNATANAWRSGEQQTDTFREARAALQLMVRDISSTTAPLASNAYTSPTPTPSPAPTPSAIAPVLVLDRYPNPVPVASDTDRAINEELYCLTNIPNAGFSSLCAVGYFCVWMPDLVSVTNSQATQTATAPSAYALYRQFLGSGRPDIRSGAVFVPGATGLYDRFQTAGNHHPMSFMDLFERAAPGVVPDPTNPVATTTELCSYIWDLQFRTIKSLQAQNTPSELPAQTPYPTQLPTYVEIRFKALSASAARQLEGNGTIKRDTWQDASSNPTLYQRIIQPGTRQFVARVPIGSGSTTF